MRKRKNLDLEIIQIEKKGIKANFNDGAVKRKKLMGTPKEREPQQTKNFRVGFGKYDLDTGLNEKMKRGARKEKQSKSLNIYKQTYQDLQEQRFNQQKPQWSRKSDIDIVEFGSVHESDEDEPKNPILKQLEEDAFKSMFAQTLEEQSDEMVRQEMINNQDKMVTLMFDKNTNLIKEINHLQYIKLIENETSLEQIINNLREKHLREIVNYGNQKFKNTIKQCIDRRLLFNLIQGEISIDQFITRVNCEANGIKYYCKDDMLERGIHPSYFNNLAKTEQYLLAVHGADNLIEIPPDSITYQGGRPRLTEDEIVSNPELVKKNKVQLNKMYLDDQKKNHWRCKQRCLKSFYTIIDKKLQQKNEQRMIDQQTGARQQKFLKSKTLRLDIPRPKEEEVKEHKKKEYERKVQWLLKQKFQQFREKYKRNKSDESKLAGSVADLSQASLTQKLNQTLQGIMKMSLEQQKSPTGSQKKPELALSETLSDQRSKHDAPADQAKALLARKKRQEQEFQKFQTKEDLLFIRTLMEQGIKVSFDPETKINMMYQQERDDYLHKIEQMKKIKPRKKGPREIMGKIKPVLVTEDDEPPKLKLKREFTAEGFKREITEKSRRTLSAGKRKELSVLRQSDLNSLLDTVIDEAQSFSRHEPASLTVQIQPALSLKDSLRPKFVPKISTQKRYRMFSASNAKSSLRMSGVPTDTSVNKQGRRTHHSQVRSHRLSLRVETKGLNKSINYIRNLGIPVFVKSTKFAKSGYGPSTRNRSPQPELKNSFDEFQTDCDKIEQKLQEQVRAELSPSSFNTLKSVTINHQMLQQQYTTHQLDQNINLSKIFSEKTSPQIMIAPTMDPMSPMNPLDDINVNIQSSAQTNFDNTQRRVVGNLEIEEGQRADFLSDHMNPKTLGIGIKREANQTMMRDSYVQHESDISMLDEQQPLQVNLSFNKNAKRNHIQKKESSGQIPYLGLVGPLQRPRFDQRNGVMKTDLTLNPINRYKLELSEAQQSLLQQIIEGPQEMNISHMYEKMDAEATFTNQGILKPMEKKGNHSEDSITHKAADTECDEQRIGSKIGHSSSHKQKIKLDGQTNHSYHYKTKNQHVLPDSGSQRSEISDQFQHPRGSDAQHLKMESQGDIDRNGSAFSNTRFPINNKFLKESSIQTSQNMSELQRIILS